MTKSKMMPIAIVGVSALVPGADHVLNFWRNIIQKKNLIREVPSTHWLISDFYDPNPSLPDKTYCKNGAFIDPVLFDYRDFGIPPNNLNATDANQLLSLIVAKQVLQDATNGKYASMDLSRVSVIIGITLAQELSMYISARLQKPILSKILKKYGVDTDLAKNIEEAFSNAYIPWQENTFPGLLGNIVAGRIANRFNLGGMNCTTDAACASSLASISTAMNELILNKCDMAIAGGADTLNDPFTFVCFSKTPALSPTGDCRPFSDSADGTILGEGLCFLALKRLEDAEKDGNHIYAIIRGIGSSSDGRSKSIYAPDSQGQANAILRAYENASLSIDTVELIEAHGTATKAGDFAEINGLKKVFDKSNDYRKKACAIGAIKSQLGHAKGAAGSISMLKTIFALHHKILPPTIKISKINSDLPIKDTPLYINTEARPWIHNEKTPRRAGVSSFGFGGSNFHIVLEEYKGQHSPFLLSSWPSELMIFSANDINELYSQIKNILENTNDKEHYFSYFARKSQLEINIKCKLRLALVVKNNKEFKNLLMSITEYIKLNGHLNQIQLPNVYYGEVNVQQKLAFLFPGQGSQYLNMGIDLTMAFPSIRSIWDRYATENPKSKLWNTVYPPPGLEQNLKIEQEKLLNDTQYAQPALGLVSMMLFQFLTDLNIKADYMAGHSFGEISALYSAGVFSAQDMLNIANKRVEVMTCRNHVKGAMLAVSASSKTVSNLLKSWKLNVAIANYNSPKQVVLTGSSLLINEAYNKFKNERIASHLLPVSGSFHSDELQQEYKPFHQFLSSIKFNKFNTAVYSNVTGHLHENEPIKIKKLIAQQLYQPVQFQKIIESMYQENVKIFVEVGPRNILSKLVKQCLPDTDITTIELDQKGSNGVTQLWHSLSVLFTKGFNPDFKIIWSQYLPIDSTEFAPPSPYTVTLTGTTYGKPYPGSLTELNEPSVSFDKRGKIATMDKPLKNNESQTQDNRLELFEVIQQQTLEAQKNYQKTMLESHLAYLKTSETIINMLLQNKTATSTVPLSMEKLIPAEHDVIDQTKNLNNISVNSHAIQITPPVELQTINTKNENLKQMMFDIISEKTGYPIDMLTMDMSLEADLGIDSIKKVEILSDLQEKFPNLPEVDPAILSNLNTLNEIISFITTMQKDSASFHNTVVDITQNNIEMKEKVIKRYDVIASPSTPPGFPIVEMQNIKIGIIKDKKGICEGLQKILKDNNCNTVLLDDLIPDLDLIIYLKTLDETPQIEDALKLNRQVFHFAKQISKMKPLVKTFITVIDTGGYFSFKNAHPVRAYLSGVTALMKTAQREWPNTKCKTIDISSTHLSAQQVALKIYDELIFGGDEMEIGLPSDDIRIKPEMISHHIQQPRSDILLNDDLRLLVTGGGHGITAICLTALARKIRLKGVICGRTVYDEKQIQRYSNNETEDNIKSALIEKYKNNKLTMTPKQIEQELQNIINIFSIKNTLETLNNLGSEFVYQTVDVTNKESLKNVIDYVKNRWGGLDGLIHGAGIISDKLILDKSEHQFNRVFATKVASLQHLLALTKDDPLKLICLFSSIAARLGNSGQVDYAMANEILNKVAQAEYYRREQTCLVKSINWGPWEGGMVNGSLKKLMIKQGISLLSAFEGGEQFVQEILLADGKQIEVILGSGQAAGTLEVKNTVSNNG